MKAEPALAGGGFCMIFSIFVYKINGFRVINIEKVSQYYL